MGPPRLVLTAEDDSFDQTTIQNWKDEGFQVTYLPFTGSRKQYEQDLHCLPDPLELGEKYAIVGWFFHPVSYMCAIERKSQKADTDVCLDE